MRELKKYCEGLDCAICDEKEPCIRKIANVLEEKLLRKEQECERLQKVIKEAENAPIDFTSYLIGECLEKEYRQQLDQLKAENEELKKIFERAKKAFKLQFEDLKKIREYSNKRGEENDQLKQSLAEIKEIATTGLEGFCPKCSRKDCEDNNCIETATRDILQKINECERTLC